MGIPAKLNVKMWQKLTEMTTDDNKLEEVVKQNRNRM